MAIFKTLGKGLAAILFVFVCWLSFNIARTVWQNHQIREANIDAVVFLMDYNIKAGVLKTPAPAAPAPK